MLFRSVVLQIAAVIFIASMAFADSIKGTLTVSGKMIELKKIYAEYVEDPNFEGQQFVMLRLADVELQDTKKSVMRERRKQES
jgi:hypothetical protein